MKWIIWTLFRIVLKKVNLTKPDKNMYGAYLTTKNKLIRNIFF